VEKVRGDFPILRHRVRGRTLVYLDNAATSQKPQVVIDAIGRYYERDNANIQRPIPAESVAANPQSAPTLNSDKESF